MRENDPLLPASTDPTAATPAVDRRGLPAAGASPTRNSPDVLTVVVHLLARQAAADASALADSGECDRKCSKVTLDHEVLISPKFGIPNYQACGIGQPLEVWQCDWKTFVKAKAHAGEGPATEKVKIFWPPLVDIHPPARWQA